MKFLTTLTQKTMARVTAELTTGQLSRVTKLGVVAAAVGSVALMGASTAAMATGLNQTMESVNTNTSYAADMITYGAYIMGTAFSVMGLLDVKKHIDQPGQNPLKNGLGKIGTGGLLLFLPYVLNTAMDTVGADGAASDLQKMGDTSI